MTAVLPLTTGRVVLGSEEDGVLALDGKALTQLHPALSGEHITALAGTEANLWAGTIDHGLLHWHSGQLDHFTEGCGLPDPRVLSLAISANVFSRARRWGRRVSGRPLHAHLGPRFLANPLLMNDETLSVGMLARFRTGYPDGFLAEARRGYAHGSPFPASSLSR